MQKEIKKFLKETDAGPRLARSEEKGLIESAQAGNRDAAIRIIESCYRVITSETSKFITQHRYGRTKSEQLFFACFHNAVTHVYEALSRFDPSYGTRFITYAMQWIRLGIRKEILVDAKSFQPINNLTDKTEMGFVDIDEIEELEDVEYDQKKDEKTLLRQALNNGFLSFVEKYVLKSRYGLGGQEHTTDEIASVLKKSTKAILEIENGALRKLYLRLSMPPEQERTAAPELEQPS